jgi:hypothetical protein
VARVRELHPSSFASIELQYKLAARVGRDRSFRDFVHVLLDRGCEPLRLNGRPRPHKSMAYCGPMTTWKRVPMSVSAHRMARPVPGSKVTLLSKIIAGYAQNVADSEQQDGSRDQAGNSAARLT